jgi:hypothetical protein
VHRLSICLTNPALESSGLEILARLHFYRGYLYGRLHQLDKALQDLAQVRKTPSWPKSWANASLL